MRVNLRIKIRTVNGEQSACVPGGVRINCRVAYDELLRRIEERRALLGVSERRLCELAGLPVDRVRTIRRGNAPRAETLVALAKALKIDPAYLIQAAEEPPAADAALA